MRGVPGRESRWLKYSSSSGLEYGIESFVVAFILNYGLIAMVVFFPPLAVFFYLVARATGPGGTLATMYFLAVCLTSISLSSKSPSLSIFVLLLLVLLRTDRPSGEFRQ
jgi:hypothetical protein